MQAMRQRIRLILSSGSLKTGEIFRRIAGRETRSSFALQATAGVIGTELRLPEANLWKKQGTCLP
ncbi:hypothetical protein [Arthrobacter sp. AQ5-05]|uniref:hypothetical protein n=1 Tax=Arthrobacter sp. AQ5-05 TaxID=2184581 RepID=UPI0015EB8BAC|nr:hypothetical protein [Arthrobacter sp. AQ5-05]